MAHGAAVAHMQRHAPLDMQHAVILNVGAPANDDLIQLGADHRAEEHAALRADADIAHHRGGRGDKNGLVNFRYFHGAFSLILYCFRTYPAA